MEHNKQNRQTAMGEKHNEGEKGNTGTQTRGKVWFGARRRGQNVRRATAMETPLLPTLYGQTEVGFIGQ